MKTTVELVTQNSYDRRHKKKSPRALAKDREIKQKPNQKTRETTPRTTENTKKQQWILWATKLDTPTHMPGKNDRTQQLPDNKAVCTDMPQ